MPLSIIMCLLQALLTIGASNATATVNSIYVTSTLIPVVGFAVLAVKYGGESIFDKVRLNVSGLIVGELMAVFLRPMITLLTGIKIGTVTPNRYST